MPKSTPLQFSCFEDFWQEYVSQHRHPANQVLHVLGTIGGLICVALACVISWKWILAILPVGYGLAWIGHYAIERNRPLTLTYPLWSFRADWRMVLLLLMKRRLSTDSLETKSRRAA